MKFISGVLLVGLLGVQAPAQTMGRLTLDERFGRALFSHCVFTVYYFQPHMPKVDRVELNCTPLAGLPNQETMSATRTLTAEESDCLERDLPSLNHLTTHPIEPLIAVRADLIVHTR